MVQSLWVGKVDVLDFPGELVGVALLLDIPKPLNRIQEISTHFPKAKQRE